MSDISRVVMDALRRQLRDLEFDAVLIRGKVEQLHATIDWLENGERPRGRPRAVSIPNPTTQQGLRQALNTANLEMPERVDGGMHQPEPQDAA